MMNTGIMLCQVDGATIKVFIRVQEQVHDFGVEIALTEKTHPQEVWTMARRNWMELHYLKDADYRFAALKIKLPSYGVCSTQPMLVWVSIA